MDYELHIYMYINRCLQYHCSGSNRLLQLTKQDRCNLVPSTTNAYTKISEYIVQRSAYQVTPVER